MFLQRSSSTFVQTEIWFIFCPAPTCGANLGSGLSFCCVTGVLLAWPGSVFVPGYGFLSVAFFCSTGGTNGFGTPGLTAVLLPAEEKALVGLGFGSPFALGYGFGSVLLKAGVDEGPLKDDVAPVRAFWPPLGTPPMALVAPPVAPPAMLRVRPTPPVTAFLAVPAAPLTWLLAGYLLAPKGVEPMALETGLLDAGSEFERLTTGLRAVDGRALGDGW